MQQTFIISFNNYTKLYSCHGVVTMCLIFQTLFPLTSFETVWNFCNFTYDSGFWYQYQTMVEQIGGYIVDHVRHL